MTARRSTFTTLLLFYIFGCSTSDSAQIVGKAGYITVQSEFREYYRDGGRTQYRDISLKHKGWSVDPDELGKKLFSSDSACHTPFYRLSDVRILKDNTVLALFVDTDQRCGTAHLAKIESKDGELNIQRIPLLPFGPAPTKPRYPGAATSTQLGHVVDQRVQYDYANTTDTLEKQQRSAEQWVFLNSLTGTEASNSAIAYESEYAFAVEMVDGKAKDLGLGHMEGVLGDGRIALIRHAVLSKPTRAFVEFRAVRIVDGVNVDSQRLPLHCFEPVGTEAIESEKSQINWSEQDDRNQARREAMIEEDRRALGWPPLNSSTPEERAELARKREVETRLSARNSAVSRYLEAKNIEAEWKNDRVNIKVSDQLREKPNCVARPA